MSTVLGGPALGPAPGAGRRRTVNRLKRAQGQLAALIAAVESGADCRGVITQLSAVRGALDKAGFELISSAMRDCLADSPALPGAEGADSPAGGKPTLDEIRGLFLRLT